MNYTNLVPFLKTHLFYVLLFLGAIFAGHSWLVEHDNRLLAEQIAKVSEADAKASAQRVVDLENTVKSTQAAADAATSTLRASLIAIKTPAQALPVIVREAPELHATQLPDSTVSVDPIQLATQITQCKIDEVQLTACRQELSTETEIAHEKDGQLLDKQKEIVALKKPQGFWKRLKGTTKVFGIGVGVGIALVATHVL